MELALRFQDTILGHLFGHMNADHFFFLEAQDLRIFPDEEKKTFNDKDLLASLLEDFATLPQHPKESDMDGYAVVNVAPSVVPNPYLPSFRIYSYNTSGERPSEQEKRKHGHRRGSDGNNGTCKSAKYAETWRCHLNKAWHSDGQSPSRSNREWTPLGYAQYYMRKLGREGPRVELEYVTYTIEGLQAVPEEQLPEELRLSGVRSSKYVAYKMRDLTIGSWLRLGGAVGRTERLRRKFREYMFME